MSERVENPEKEDLDAKNTGEDQERVSPDEEKNDEKLSEREQKEDLWVGWDSDGEEIFIDPQKLNRHMAVLGSTGSGKTVLCKAVVEEAILRGIPIIAVDPQGDIVRLGLMEDRAVLEEKNIPIEFARDYESKVGVTVFTPGTKDGIKIVVDPVNSFPRAEDRGKLSESKVLKVLSGVSSAIVSLFSTTSKQKLGFMEHIIYKALEIAYKDNQDIHSMRAFFDYLKSDSARDKLESSVSPAIMKSYDDMLAEFEMILEGPTGTLFKDGVPLNLDLLLKEKNGRVPLNIFYLNTMEDENLKQFFLSYLGNEIYSYMMRKGNINALLFIDEVKIFLPPGVQKTLSKSILVTLLEQGRKYGLKILMATQSPGKIDYQAFGQCNTRAYGILSTKQDLDKVKDSVPDHVKENLPRLASGSFFLQDPKGDFQRLKVRWLYTDHGEPVPARKLKDMMLDETIEYYQQVMDGKIELEATPDTKTMTSAQIEMPELPEFPEAETKELRDNSRVTAEKPLKKPAVSDQETRSSTDVKAVPVNTSILHDLMKVVNVLIIHKRSGICILDRSMGMISTDPQLIAGFLHALMTWMKEISPSRKEYGRRMQLKKFSREGFTIWVVDGNFTALALIMKREPRTNEILIRMQKFVISFEKSYQKELKNFLGDMNAFDVDHVDELLEKTLGISLLYPFKLEHDKVPNYAGDDFKTQVISYIKEKEETYLADEEGVFLEELLNYGVNELGTISRKMAMADLLELVREEILTPVYGIIWFKDTEEAAEKALMSEKAALKQTVGVSEDIIERQLIEEDLPELDIEEELPGAPVSPTGKSLAEPLALETAGELEEEMEPDLAAEKDTTITGEVTGAVPGWVNYQVEQLQMMPITSAPARIAVDILKREIIYQDKLRAIERTMKRIDATTSNIDKHVALIASKGYIIDSQEKNSVNGMTYLFENEKDGHKVVFATVKLDSTNIVALLFDSRN
ncbi:MAG: ATP-binding protein [Candidatus Odinarchaeota archaeon]